MIRFLKRGVSAEQDAAEQSRVRQTVESILADIERRGDDAVLAAATLLQPLTGCIIPVDGGRPLA